MKRTVLFSAAGVAVLVVAAGGAFLAGRQLGSDEAVKRIGTLPSGTAVVSAALSEGREPAPAITPSGLGAGMSFAGGAAPGPLGALPAMSAISAPTQSAVAITSFTPRQQTEIGEIVRQFLLANPEVLRDAATALDAKQAAEDAATQRVAIKENREEIYNSKNQVVLGNPNGDVTLVEFFDYNCGYCRKAEPDIAQLLKEDSKLKIVLKQFPILGQGSVEAAQVGIALDSVAPGQYSAFHERLLTDPAPAGGDRALAVADAMGLDTTALKAKMAEAATTDSINAVYGLANNLGLTGTPTFVIGDQLVLGAVGHDTLKTKIAAMRACGSPDCPAQGGP